MPRNGTGTYTPPSSPGAFNPAVTGQQATPVAWNALLVDLSAALTQSLSKDGQTMPTANLPMDGFRHTGVGDGVAADDYAALGQVQGGITSFAQTAGDDDMVATLTPALTAYVVGQTFILKKSGTDNSTAVTLDLGPGAGDVVWPNGSPLTNATLRSNSMFEVSVQDATPIFHLLSVTAPPLSASVLTTEGDIIYRNATVPTRLGIGAAGTVLGSNGTIPGWVAGVGSVHKQKFTATGTYTPNAKMLYAMLECVGGGGGGGGVAGDGNSIAGGGGGSGGYSRTLATATDIGASKAVTIGAAGAGGTAGANNGTAGGATSVGTLCVANGGLGGMGQGSLPLVADGVLGGAAGTGDDVAATGAPGGTGMYSDGGFSRGISGAGGSSYFGGGGRPRIASSATNAGYAATAYGGGGGGAVTHGVSSNAAGGAGFAGYVVITEYCSA